MNKFLTRIVGATLGVAMAFGVGVGISNGKKANELNAATSTYSYTFTSKQFTANNQSKTLNGVSWTADGSGAYWGYDATKGQQFGSGSAVTRDLTLTTSGISGTISTVVVQASTANSSTANINCTIAGDDFGAQAQALTNTNSSYTFSGSASGEIVINLKQPSTSKALYVKAISVTYSTGPETLSAPQNVSYNSSLQRVSWSSVDHATGYYFSSNNGESYSEKTTNLYYDVSGLADGEYSVKIKAAGDGEDYNDSEPASFVLNKVSTPIYESVSVNKTEISGSYKGSAYIQCSATVVGQNNPSQAVTWSITSSNTFGTGTEIANKATIDQTGKIVFLDNTDTLYVWALAADGETKGSTTISASGLTDAPGSLNNPFTVAQARAHIDSVIVGGEATGNDGSTYYATGIVSEIVTAYSSQYHNISYNISSDGLTASDQLQAYRGKGNGGANFTSSNDVVVGDEVVVLGYLKKYGEIYEFEADNQLVSRVEAPHINSVTLTPDSITLEPNATGSVTSLFTNIAIDQNASSHKTASDIVWSSDDTDVISITNNTYTVTGNHRDSTTIKASIGGVEYDEATITIFDSNMRTMSYDTRIWTRVADPSTLVAGDKIILTGTSTGTTYGANAYVSGQNNVKANTTNILTVEGDNVTGVVDSMIYTLETGEVAGSLALKDSNNKYLYAASSSSNYLKGQDDIDENASFIFNSNGTVVAQGSNTRSYMRYNSSDKLFACYASNSTTGTLVTFYKLNGGAGEIDLPSYSEIKVAHQDENSKYVRLGVTLSEDDWNTIESSVGISGYGVMMIRETTLENAGFNSIKDVYLSTANNKPALRNLNKASTSAPSDFAIAAKINMSNDGDCAVVFCAAAYVISENGTYCFISETRGSLNGLLG